MYLSATDNIYTETGLDKIRADSDLREACAMDLLSEHKRKTPV